MLEEAIQRGGQSSWFNRMRGSLNRVRNQLNVNEMVIKQEYATEVIHRFYERLEHLGTSGTKFQKFVNDLGSRLKSESHAEYQKALEELGTLLGYRTQRPKHNASADCTWRGEFGNSREFFAFEAKIEHELSNSITAAHLGQAHVQLYRAKEEYGTRGYSVRAVVVTHLKQLASDAQPSVGSVKFLHKDVVLALWDRVRDIMIMYRSHWHIDDVQAKRVAEEAIRPRLPKTGWLLRALDQADLWEIDILKEWS